MKGPGGALPEGLLEAYEGLVELVTRISAGVMREEVLREEVDGWRREDCRSGDSIMYQRFICDVTIDMVRLKQAFDGSEAATASPFPVP